jgi:Tol biopolymer transport system component
MNLDGSDLIQLTDDGAEKNRVGWTPDGNAVTYIAGKCVWSVELASGRLDHIACFEYAKFLDDFSISSDGTQVAISVNSEMFIVPYDLDQLSQASRRNDLIGMGVCEALAPLKTNTGASVIVNQVRWSQDDTQIATMIKAPEGGIQVDLIRFLDITNCENPDRLDEFPATRFDIAGYDKQPYLQNFGYDGVFLFAMTSYTRNDGFGDLYIYNTFLHRADKEINPIDGKCCYRDPQFSPDGSYLVFVYQPFEAGAAAELYYVLYATISAGGRMEPLPIPEGFFTDPKVKPQPALRPAGSGP